MKIDVTNVLVTSVFGRVRKKCIRKTAESAVFSLIQIPGFFISRFIFRSR